ncbi:MAG: arsenate reductase ArsC [Acidobacteria bacterium]|nr:arsenate reductase ArsC [Acidobacteriota bacterium]
MTKNSILFICRHNSGRSQIAEGYVRRFAGDRWEASSAGFEPAEQINPLVVEAMQEEGIDLSGKTPRSAFDLFRRGALFGVVVTVCDDSESECPVYPGITRRVHHPFPDPAAATGSREERLAAVRAIRDAIREWILGPDSPIAGQSSKIEYPCLERKPLP